MYLAVFIRGTPRGHFLRLCLVFVCIQTQTLNSSKRKQETNQLMFVLCLISCLAGWHADCWLDIYVAPLAYWGLVDRVYLTNEMLAAVFFGEFVRSFSDSLELRLAL